MHIVNILVLFVLASFCAASSNKYDKLQFRENAASKDWPTQPPWTEKARVARYVVHYANWTVVSAMSPEFMQPFGTLQSYADGLLSQSTGIPYFYVSHWSDTYKNIQHNSTVSITVTEFQGNICKDKGLDPEEPPCSRVTLAGQIVPVTDPDEKTFAKKVLFTRHPVMKTWPVNHGWTFFKMNVRHVYLLDYYGGASHVSVQDYFNAKP